MLNYVIFELLRRTKNINIICVRNSIDFSPLEISIQRKIFL